MGLNFRYAHHAARVVLTTVTPIAFFLCVFKKFHVDDTARDVKLNGKRIGATNEEDVIRVNKPGAAGSVKGVNA